MNDFVLTRALTTSFAIPTQWLSYTTSTIVYNRMNEIVMFQLTSNKSKRLIKKQLAQILKVPYVGEFDDVKLFICLTRRGISQHFQ